MRSIMTHLTDEGIQVEGHLSSYELQGEVDRLARELERWRAAIPPFLVENAQNRHHYLSNGLGTSFAALHLGFHYYNVVLYYQFMAIATRRTNASPMLPARSYAERCTHHAMAFCDILYDCDAATNGQEMLYIMLGHMLVVTSTVYMHMLLFNTAYTVSARTLRERLARNFGILTKLQQYWKTLGTSLSRLKVFHNTCLKSIEGSFDMDQWMLKFILEYALSMPEKEKFSGNPDRSSEIMSLQDPPSTTLQDWYSKTFMDPHAGRT